MAIYNIAMQRDSRKLRTLNLISVIFFLLAAVVYLVHEKYSFLRPEQVEDLSRVVTVHDGDTMSVIMHGQQAKLRLIGIDAPEIAQVPWGEKAKRHLESLVSSSGNSLQIERDVEKNDQYGRILAYAWTAEGRLINLEMIKSGYAVLYTVPPNVKYAAEFRKAQAEARAKGRGLWGENGLGEMPRDYRKKHPRI